MSETWPSDLTPIAYSSLQSDVKNIEQLSHAAIDELMQHTPSYTVTSEQQTQFTTIKHIIQKACKYEWSQEQLSSFLTAQQVSPSTIPSLTGVYHARHVSLFDYLRHKSCTISPAALHDYDWRAKLVLSSSAISQLHTGMVRLHLIVLNTNNNNKEDVYVEMNVDELDAFLKQMEQIKNTVLQLSD